MTYAHKAERDIVIKPNRAGVLPRDLIKFRSLWGSLFVIGVAWGFTMPLFSVVMVEAGVSIQTYGLLQSYAALASMLAQIWIGRFSDRIGRRKPLLLISLLTMAPIVALFPRADVALSFGVLLAVHNIAQNAFRAMNNAWVSSWAAEGSLGRLYGTFRIAGSLGWIVATPVMGIVRSRYGSGAPFTVAALIYIAVAFFIAGAIPEEKRVHPPNKPVADTNDESILPDDTKQAQLSLRKQPILLVFFVALGFFYLSQGMGLNLNSIYLKQDLGLSDTHFGWMISIQAWFEVPLMLLLGSMSDRFNPTRVLGIGFLMSGLRWLLLSLVTSPTWLFPVQSLHAVGVTVGEVLAIAFIAKYVAQEALGTALGWKLAVQNGTMLLAPTIGGYIAHGHGIVTTFQLSAALALIAGAMLFIGLRRPLLRNAG